MIAGRKLLLADDSVAIQKVVDLTFTDEGMEVTTVGDGQDALAKLEQFTPDVVLADVYMPGVDGFELCKFIKQDARLRDVPVMLLIGSFEPFDEADAKRAGADDVVTKPFQSIRDLVSRVGSLVSHDDASKQSVLGLREEEESTDVAPVAEQSAEVGATEMEAEQPHIKVFVEAPSMEPDATVLVEAPLMEVEQTPEHTCPTDIDLQTADTQQLRPVAPVEFSDEGVLDLGDVDNFAARPVENDFELDLELESFEVSPAAVEREDQSTASHEPSSESAILSAVDVESAEHLSQVEPVANESSAIAFDAGSDADPKDLSAATIEAISRRVVEQLSDKVVREIAWEVVPELSELLIKKQLDERR